MTIPNIGVVNLPGVPSLNMDSDRFKGMTSQDLEKAFIDAAKTGCLETVESIMSLDTFKIAPDTLAEAFIEAAGNSHVETVRAIKNFFQNSHSRYEPPDLSKDFMELIEALIDPPNSAKILCKALGEALVRAAGCGYVKIISLLMNCNRFRWISMKDFDRALLKAVKWKRKEIAQVLVESEVFQGFNIGSALRILGWAASKGDINTVKAILRTYEINANRRVEAYRWAISNHHKECAKAIIGFDKLKNMDSKSLEQMLIGAIFNDDAEVRDEIISIIDSDDSKDINSWSLYQDLARPNSAQKKLLGIIIDKFLEKIEPNNLNIILRWALKDGNSEVTRAILEPGKLQCINPLNLCGSFIWALKKGPVDLTRDIISQLGTTLNDLNEGPTVSDFAQAIVERFQDDARGLGEIFVWAIGKQPSFKQISLVVNSIMGSDNFKNIGSKDLYSALGETLRIDYDIEIVKPIMILAKSKVTPKQLSILFKGAAELERIEFIKIIDSDSFKEIESNILCEVFIGTKQKEIKEIILCKLLGTDRLSSDLKIVDLVQAIVNRSQNNKSRDLRGILIAVSCPLYQEAFGQIMRNFDAFRGIITPEELNEVFEEVLCLVKRKSLYSCCADIVMGSIRSYQCITSSNLTEALRWASLLGNKNLVKFIKNQANFISPKVPEGDSHKGALDLETPKELNGNPKKEINKEWREALKCNRVGEIKFIMESEGFQDIHSINIHEGFIWALKNDEIDMAQGIMNRVQSSFFRDDNVPTISDLTQAIVNKHQDDDSRELGQTLIWASSINQKEIIRTIVNSGGLKKIKSNDIDKALLRASKKRNPKEIIEILSGNGSSEKLLQYKA